MTTEYHKIESLFKRDPASKHKTMIMGEWSLPEFEYLASNNWIFTEKIDGTNIRAEIIPSARAISFKGRTDEAQIPKPLQYALSDLFFPIHARLCEAFPFGAVFYGEGYGAGIQKVGKLYRAEPSFCLFDVKVGEWWLQQDGVDGIAKDYGLQAAPVIGHGNLLDMVKECEKGFNSLWGDFPAEGIIARPEVGLFTRAGKRIITKLKLKDFAR